MKLKEIIMHIIKFPTEKEYNEILKTYPLNDINKLVNLTYKFRGFPEEYLMNKKFVFDNDIDEIQNRLDDIKYSYIMATYYFQMENNKDIKKQLDYYVSNFYTQLFSCLDVIGHLICNAFELKIIKPSLNEVLSSKYLQNYFLSFYEDLITLSKNKSLKIAEVEYRHNIIHNYLPNKTHIAPIDNKGKDTKEIGYQISEKKAFEFKSNMCEVILVLKEIINKVHDKIIELKWKDSLLARKIRDCCDILTDSDLILFLNELKYEDDKLLEYSKTELVDIIINQTEKSFNYSKLFYYKFKNELSLNTKDIADLYKISQKIVNQWIDKGYLNYAIIVTNNHHSKKLFDRFEIYTLLQGEVYDWYKNIK